MASGDDNIMDRRTRRSAGDARRSRPARWPAAKPYVASPAHQEALGFPGALVEDWQEKAIARLGELLQELAGAARLSRLPASSAAPAPTSASYFLGTGDPNNMPVARQDLLRKVYRRYFTLGGQDRAVAGRRRGPHRARCWTSGTATSTSARSAGAARLFCPYRHRHRRNLDGRPRDHGHHRQGPEILQRDHRQGVQDRQQSRPAAQGAEGDARRAGGGDRGGDRRRRPPAARRGGRRDPAGDAERRLLRLAAHGRADRLRQGAARSRASAGPSARHASEAANFGMFIGSYENMRKVALRIAQGGAAISRSSGWCSANAATPGASPTISSTRWPGRSISSTRTIRVPQHICEFTYDLIQAGQAHASTSRRTTTSA